MIKLLQKIAACLYLIALISSPAYSLVVENLTGSASNSQGQLSYSVPLDIPTSINGLAPQVSVNYSQGSAKGLLGSSFHLSVGSVITRCAPKIAYTNIQGGITLNQNATYCLDGAELINVDDSEYKTFIDTNTKLVASGDLLSPDSWTAYDASGYVYTYQKTALDVSESNKVWHLKEKKDRFNNAISYKRKANGALDTIEYPGFSIIFDYDSPTFNLEAYSNGALKPANELITDITIQNGSQPLYKYHFRYDKYSGYRGLTAERLMGIEKCYLLSTEECTKELKFEYSDLSGKFDDGDELPSKSTTILSKDTINNHADLNSVNGMPSYSSVDVDNLYGPDICFYSIVEDKLICNLASSQGKYETKDSSDSFGYTIDDFKYYSGLNFLDLNKDGYIDLCIADDEGIKCAKNNGSGFFERPTYITKTLNHSTGYQLTDINRDGYADICGATQNSEYQCFESLKGDSSNGTFVNFSSLATVIKQGDFSSDYVTPLKEYNKTPEKYKKIAAMLIDITGDQIPDLCNVAGNEFGCYKGKYTNNLLSFAKERTYGLDIYREIPKNIMDWVRPSDPRDSAGLKEKKKEFRKLKSYNERITLSFTYQDINADGLLDVCYVEEKELKCHLNTEVGFSTAEFQTSLTDMLGQLNEATSIGIIASIHYIDINADGLSDLCYMKGDSQYCGYNTGHKFTEFEQRLRITSDVAVIKSRTKVFANYIRARFDEPTKFSFSTGINVYGAAIYVNDLDGDGRTEFCTRTINGIDCHNNEQQSHYSLLTQVTDAFDNQTQFEYKNSSQGEWYNTTNNTDDGFIKITPTGLALTAMKVDTGLGESGSQFETTTYEYYDYSYSPINGESSYRQIIQQSDLSQKKQITNFYLEKYLTGKPKSVLEYQNDIKLSESVNDYEAKEIGDVFDIRLKSNITHQYDPLTLLKIRSNSKVFSDFDDHGYAKTTVETKTAGNQTKKVTTTVEYNHAEDLWILGRPAKQAVVHELTGANNQTKSMNFQYYPETQALKKQIFEEGTSYQKEIEFIYFDNGLVKEEKITGLVDDTKKQQRSANYTYNAIGQKLTASNALEQTVKTEYHATCLAPEKEYDIKGRLLVTHIYNSTCRKIESKFMSGDDITYGLDWSSETIIKPADSKYENKVIAVATETSSSGQYKASYQDRLGRTLKEVKTIAKSDNATTQALAYSHFDDKGLLIARTLPIKSISGSELQPQWITTSYDSYLRPNTVTGIAPDGSAYDRTLTYSGLTTSETFNNQTKSSTVGVLGKPLIKQEHGKKVTFTFTAMGELKSTTQNDDASTTTIIIYDAYGLKTQQVDASTGTWNYKFNAFGELYWQQDPEENETSTVYDIAGRISEQATTEGISKWAYLASGNGMGQLDNHQSHDGTKRSYQYDDLGRVSNEYLTIAGKEINRTQYSYDEFSRLITQEYNKNAADSTMRTPIKNNFDLAGRLKQVLMPADKLKSYDYSKIQSVYSAAIKQIVDIDNKVNSLKNRMSYHAKRIAFYEGKVKSYKDLEVSIQPDTSAIEKMILDQQEILLAYNKKHAEMVLKSTSYGGLSAERKYEYKGLDTGTGIHTFAYRECTKKVRRLGIFSRCGRYESGTLGVSSDDFNSLGPGFVDKVIVCTQSTGSNKNAIGPNNRRGKPRDARVVSSYRKEIGSGPNRYYRTQYVFEVCKKINKKFNVADIFGELANKYNYLSKEKSVSIAVNENIRNTIINANVSVNKEVVKYKKTWVVIASDPIIMVEVDVPYDETETTVMARPEATKYYTDKQAHYQKLADLEKGLKAPVEETLNTTTSSAESLKNAKEALLNNIKSYTSLQALEDSAAAQAQLGNIDLVLWSALDYDVNGQLKDELFGNGLMTRRVIDTETSQVSNIITEVIGGDELSNINYTYTAEGNLDTKTDVARGITESYGYLDNQLDTWSMSVHGTPRFNRDYDYDALGNITQKSASESSYLYGDTSAPYRLSSYKGEAVQYDKKGFMKEANGKSYEWTSFGKAKSVRRGGNNVAFEYDAQNIRVSKRDSYGTTYYVSPAYEQLHKTNGDIIHRYHIKNGYQAVATVERYEYAAAIADTEVDSRPQDKIAYYSRDILGSGVLITGSKAEIVANRHYTPYGESVDVSPKIADRPAAKTDLAVAEFLAKHQEQVKLAEKELGAGAKLIGRILTVTNVQDQLKGFTSHEELTDVGLVHMNARLYDPEIGRFVSPDSIVPDAGNPLAYNRYSYVYNNPALATDPSGHFALAVAAAITYFVAAQAYSDDPMHHIASAVLLSIATGNAAAALKVNAALVAGGTAIATSAAISGRIGAAEIRAGIFAYVSATVAGEIGHNGEGGSPMFDSWQATAAAHGVAQGTIGWVRDKNFWGSFVSGTVSHGVGHNIRGLGGDTQAGFMLRTGIVSASSAIVASATGGDAMQAALTAALVHMFNTEGDRFIRDKSGDPKPPGDMVIGSEGYWQLRSAAAFEAAGLSYSGSRACNVGYTTACVFTVVLSGADVDANTIDVAGLTEVSDSVSLGMQSYNTEGSLKQTGTFIVNTNRLVNTVNKIVNIGATLDMCQTWCNSSPFNFEERN
jgi:RHS repeat-associated protein